MGDCSTRQIRKEAAEAIFPCAEVWLVGRISFWQPNTRAIDELPSISAQMAPP